ncbi:hypothetical protein UY3_04623 [Chelonia mydas]|uniref:Myb/SANT-like DNA-binding domain-containing protein n=1 Tax=Chelonia mydas TaxID=8469 RepID=M7BJU7_CHEMY|nr:hypothetical protein UY3_04623 [Chelonia mydas]
MKPEKAPLVLHILQDNVRGVYNAHNSSDELSRLHACRGICLVICRRAELQRKRWMTTDATKIDIYTERREDVQGLTLLAAASNPLEVSMGLLTVETTAELLDLLGIWEKEAVQSQLRSSCRNFNTYGQISCGLCEKGYDWDTVQCIAKIKELSQAYQKAREANHHSAAAPKSCRFYKELDAILCNDPTSTSKRPMDPLVGLEAEDSGPNPKDEVVDKEMELEDVVEPTAGWSGTTLYVNYLVGITTVTNIFEMQFCIPNMAAFIMAITNHITVPGPAPAFLPPQVTKKENKKSCCRTWRRSDDVAAELLPATEEELRPYCRIATERETCCDGVDAEFSLPPRADCCPRAQRPAAPLHLPPQAPACMCRALLEDACEDNCEEDMDTDIPESTGCGNWDIMATVTFAKR